jgi:hypothetical protein
MSIYQIMSHYRRKNLEVNVYIEKSRVTLMEAHEVPIKFRLVIYNRFNTPGKVQYVKIYKTDSDIRQELNVFDLRE